MVFSDPGTRNAGKYDEYRTWITMELATIETAVDKVLRSGPLQLLPGVMELLNGSAKNGRCSPLPVQNAAI